LNLVRRRARSSRSTRRGRARSTPPPTRCGKRERNRRRLVAGGLRSSVRSVRGVTTTTTTKTSARARLEFAELGFKLGFRPTVNCPDSTSSSSHRARRTPTLARASGCDRRTRYSRRSSSSMRSSTPSRARSISNPSDSCKRRSRARASRWRSKEARRRTERRRTRKSDGNDESRD